MQCVILAGGLATRLRPLTEKIPKSLVEIAGKPFLEYQLEFLKKGGVKDIVLCVGYFGEQIEDIFGDGGRFGMDINYSYEKGQLLGTAGALKQAEPLLESRFFVMYGDSYLFLDFNSIMSYFDTMNAQGLMVVYKNDNRYDKSNVALHNNRVKFYSKTGNRKELAYIDYGASVLHKNALQLIPSNQVYSLEQLFNLLIDQKQLLAYEIHRRFYHIGSFEALEEFRQYISHTGVLS